MIHVAEDVYKLIHLFEVDLYIFMFESFIYPYIINPIDGASKDYNYKSFAYISLALFVSLPSNTDY